MPYGRVQRIDDDRDVAYILRRGRTYRAPLSEVDNKARVPSARVQFDVAREKGSESAIHVRLRSGTRTNRRHRRFGDLSGAKQPGAKVAGAAKRSYGVDVTTQPFQVVGAWIKAMRDRDYDGATSLYQSQARLHTPAGSVSGRRRIRAALEGPEAQAVDDAQPHMQGIDRYVMIASGPASGGHISYVEVEHGAIVEQWIDCVPELSEVNTSPDEVLVVRRGDVPAGTGHSATRRVREVIEHSGRPVRFARIKLTAAENQAVELSAMVEATVEFDNGLVRAHAAATTFNEAIDDVARRLRRQIEHNHDRHRHQTTGLPPAEQGWQHGNRPRIENPILRSA